MKVSTVLILLIILTAGSLFAQQPSAQTELTLQQAVTYALDHSPDLKTAIAETSKRQGNVTTARSALLPELDVAGDFGRSRLEHGYPGGTPPSLLRFAQTTYSATADLHMLAWDFQKTSLELSATRQRLTASQVLVDRKKQELIFQVAQLYLQALTYQDLLHASDLTRKSLRSLLDRTNELVKAGRAVPVDAFKIQTQIAEIDSNSATLEAGRQATLSSLAAVIGYEGQLPPLAYSPAKEVTAPATADPKQLVQDALTQRLDLKAATFDTKSAAELERAARRTYWPRIDFRASAIQYGGDNPVGFPTLIGRLLPGLPVPNFTTSSGVNDWMVGLHIGVPLFDSGRRSGQIKAAAAQTEQARMAEQKASLNVAREVQTSYAELQSAQKRVKAMQEAVVQAQEILKNEQAKYEVGRTVINFVLEAEAGVLNSQSLLSQAQRSESVATLALELSTGSIKPDSVP
ncbi:MAG TPA: TolC family protein [Terriglobales bacterium]|nr:TolC family protein [Terriglobales bacterium]